MELQTLNVTTRAEKGKGAAHRTRNADMVPTVLYGGGKDSVSLTVNKKDLAKVLHGRGGEHALVQLTVADNAALSGPAMLREVQHHPLKGHVLHADFQRISLDERITTLVPIVLTGQAAGVLLGGVLDQQLRDLEVECLALEVPENIKVDVSGMNLGDSIHVQMIAAPAGVTILTDPDRTIAAVHVPRTLSAAEEGTPAEGAEGASEAAPAKAAAGKAAGGKSESK